MALRNIEQLEGVRVGGNNKNNLRHADDTLLIADQQEKLQKVLKTVPIESENKELQLDAKKTECMVISTFQILCKGEIIKQAGTFKYLDFTTTPDTGCDPEIKKRIAFSTDTLTKMKSIFTNRNIRLNTKFNTLKAYIWCILLHGCECWTLTKDPERTLN